MDAHDSNQTAVPTGETHPGETDVTEIAGVTETTDVIVVGGGLAGLSAAVTARRAGPAVTLLDARRLGGRATSAPRQGFVLNEGPHALYRTAGGQAVLDRLGISVTGNSPDLARYETIWGGQRRTLPVSPVRLAASRLICGRGKFQLGTLYRELASLAASTPDDVSFGDWLAERRLSADARTFLLTVMRVNTYAADPAAYPAGMMLRRLQAGSGGVRYVDGGWQTIVDALDGAARRAGVVVHDHTAVTSVERRGDWWVATTGTGQVVARAIVLAAGGPSVAVRLLGDDRAGWADRAGQPVRAACLDVGIDAALGVTTTFVLSADAPLYLSQHAPVAALAAGGRQLYSVMRYLPDHPTEAAVARAEIETHAAAGGLPGPGPDRLIERFLASAVVAWGRPLVGVARPNGHELVGDGVLAAGDWVGPTLLADAALVSGESAGWAAARHALAGR